VILPFTTTRAGVKRLTLGGNPRTPRGLRAPVSLDAVRAARTERLHPPDRLATALRWCAHRTAHGCWPGESV
jgi:hypothetical protein